MGVGGAQVKAESSPASLDAATVEKVVKAATAAQEEHQKTVEGQRVVCDLCGVRRADLVGPCGHKYHARESAREREKGGEAGGGGVSFRCYR